MSKEIAMDLGLQDKGPEYQRGVEKLAAWHYECAIRRRKAAMAAGLDGRGNGKKGTTQMKKKTPNAKNPVLNVRKPSKRTVTNKTTKTRKAK